MKELLPREECNRHINSDSADFDFSAVGNVSQVERIKAVVREKHYGADEQERMERFYSLLEMDDEDTCFAYDDDEFIIDEQGAVDPDTFAEMVGLGDASDWLEAESNLMHLDDDDEDEDMEEVVEIRVEKKHLSQYGKTLLQRLGLFNEEESFVDIKVKIGK